MAVGVQSVPQSASVRTSARASRCLAATVIGYFVLTVIAGAPDSPMATPLPSGAQSPRWSTFLAERVGFSQLGRPVLTAISLLLMAGLLGAFTVLLLEARSNRVRLSAVLIAGAISLGLVAIAPVLLSRDVFSYAAYGRIYAIHHHNPYVAVPAMFSGDPFVSLTAGQWLHVHSLYGPLFTLLSASIVRTWPRSPDATILAFKLTAAVAIGAAAAFTSIAAVRIRPDRAALAAALVALNPVVVVHTVGGAHVDALIAAPLAGALALVAAGRDVVRSSTLRACAVTALLALACLIKVVVTPALVLWLWWIVRDDPWRMRIRTLAVHLSIVVGLTAVLLLPFLAGSHTFVSLATLGGVESWASPSRLVARGVGSVARSLAGAGSGSVASKVVTGAFLVAFATLFWRLAARRTAAARAMADGWGTSLLLLSLALPYLLPWYSAWFVPFLGLMADGVTMGVGVAVTGLLALTIIPADPPHGLSAWGVMDSVHYLVAPVMLALFAVLAFRIARRADESAALLRPPA